MLKTRQTRPCADRLAAIGDQRRERHRLRIGRRRDRRLAPRLAPAAASVGCGTAGCGCAWIGRLPELLGGAVVGVATGAWNVGSGAGTGARVLRERRRGNSSAKQPRANATIFNRRLPNAATPQAAASLPLDWGKAVS